MTLLYLQSNARFRAAEAIELLQAALRRMVVGHAYGIDRIAKQRLQAKARLEASKCLQSCVRRRLAMAATNAAANARANEASALLQSSVGHMPCIEPNQDREAYSRRDHVRTPIARLRDLAIPLRTPPNEKSRDEPDGLCCSGTDGGATARRVSDANSNSEHVVEPLEVHVDQPIRKIASSVANNARAAAARPARSYHAATVASELWRAATPLLPQTPSYLGASMTTAVLPAQWAPLPTSDPLAGGRLQARAQLRALATQARVQEEESRRNQCADLIKFAQDGEGFNREGFVVSRKEKGPEHPETLLYARKLISALSLQGKYAEAEVIEREVLVVRKRVFGAEHPDSLASISNLATLLSCQGKPAEAAAMNRDVLAIRRRMSAKGSKIERSPLRRGSMHPSR